MSSLKSSAGGRTRGQFWTGASRVLASALVLICFFATLVAATAQQQIVESLRPLQDDRPIGLREGLTRWNALRATDRSLASQRQRLAEANKRIDTLNGEIDRHESEANLLMAEAASTLRLVQPLCPAISLDFTNRIAIAGGLKDAQNCLRLQPNAAAERDQVFETRAAFVPVMQASIQANDRRFREEAKRDKLEESLAVASAAPDADRLRAAFQDFEFVSGMSPMAWLVSAPLFVTQLLLVSAAGSFGAILVLLIVIVYPESQMRLSQGEGFLARIALGAIVALAFYVVLTSGVAVMQGDAAIAADANVMTFALIGLIAGAFSNKVAQWLTSRAEHFLGIDPTPRAADASADHSEVTRP